MNVNVCSNFVLGYFVLEICMNCVIMRLCECLVGYLGYIDRKGHVCLFNRYMLLRLFVNV
jgi:hypothetical protein